MMIKWQEVLTKGICYICKKELGKGAMKNHLMKSHKLSERKVNYFLVKVEGFYDKDYWLYLKIKDSATLGELDSFLRDIWLECCGHLSAFKIGEYLYESNDNDDFSLFRRNVIDMDKTKLKDV